ncbi:MAG: hypothetical protein PHQ60_14960, partial [Sideroxydans sp.]|nr:hypothetical protein [Sideroxydans sp.]
GDDLIEGGAGRDIIWGYGGNDRIYADTQIDTATAIANGNKDAGGGQRKYQRELDGEAADTGIYKAFNCRTPIDGRCGAGGVGELSYDNCAVANDASFNLFERRAA